jgi:hypothetical protein
VSDLADHERLWRRVSSVDVVSGSVTSSPFKSESMCVHVASRSSLEAVTAKYPLVYLYEFTVAQAKIAGALSVDDAREPGDDEDHAMVQPKEVTKRQNFARGIKAIAKCVHAPPPTLKA